MAIIYSYPTVIPTVDDLLLGTDVTATGNPTKNFTIESLITLIQGDDRGLGYVLNQSGDARFVNPDGSFGPNQSAFNFLDSYISFRLGSTNKLTLNLFFFNFSIILIKNFLL